jgi:hypothetical protein
VSCRLDADLIRLASVRPWYLFLEPRRNYTLGELHSLSGLSTKVLGEIFDKNCVGVLFYSNFSRTGPARGGRWIPGQVAILKFESLTVRGFEWTRLSGAISAPCSEALAARDGGRNGELQSSRLGGDWKGASLGLAQSCYDGGANTQGSVTIPKAGSARSRQALLDGLSILANTFLALALLASAAITVFAPEVRIMSGLDRQPSLRPPVVGASQVELITSEEATRRPVNAGPTKGTRNVHGRIETYDVLTTKH